MKERVGPPEHRARGRSGSRRPGHALRRPSPGRRRAIGPGRRRCPAGGTPSPGPISAEANRSGSRRRRRTATRRRARGARVAASSCRRGIPISAPLHDTEGASYRRAPDAQRAEIRAVPLSGHELCLAAAQDPPDGRGRARDSSTRPAGRHRVGRPHGRPHSTHTGHGPGRRDHHAAAISTGHGRRPHRLSSAQHPRVASPPSGDGNETVYRRAWAEQPAHQSSRDLSWTWKTGYRSAICSKSASVAAGPRPKLERACTRAAASPLRSAPAA
jgi:hypothetical protein